MTTADRERTDELARNAALNAIADHIERMEPDAEGHYLANLLLNDLIATVTWERELNENDIPVRRYVLRSEWLVDPEGMTRTPFPATLTDKASAEYNAMATLIVLGKLRMTHDRDRCLCDGTVKLTAACIEATAAGLPGAK